MPKIRIVIDPELCIGAASCVTIIPDYYQLNEENKAVVKDPTNPNTPDTYDRTVEVSDRVFEDIVLGAESCPTKAITIFDDSGNQLYPKG